MSRVDGVGALHAIAAIASSHRDPTQALEPQHAAQQTEPSSVPQPLDAHPQSHPSLDEPLVGIDTEFTNYRMCLLQISGASTVFLVDMLSLKSSKTLDKMLAAIHRDRTENAFITNVNYWRPPANRNPEAEELAVCRPFVDRMVELVAPKVIIAAGGVPAKSLLDSADGIMRLRGTEHVFKTAGGFTAPLIPILHPAYLLRRPQDKSRAWRDLLLVEQRLGELGG